MTQGRVYIVRHGNTFDKGDTILRVGGKTDLPLSRSGKKQANQLRETFEGVKFEAAFSSDLKRTRETIEAILGNQRYALASFLTEVDYGPDEGKPESDVVARLGAEALKRWDLEAVPPPGWHVDVNGLRTAWQAFLAQSAPDANTLVVTSNGVARFVLDVVSHQGPVPLKLRTGAYGRIDLTDRGPVLAEWDVRPGD